MCGFAPPPCPPTRPSGNPSLAVEAFFSRRFFLCFCARLAEGADFSERGIVSPSVRCGQEDSGIFRFAL